MVARDLLLAELTGARYHVAHISTRNAVAMVALRQARGLPVTCEATPHHFALTDADMAPYDSNYKMKPPLRSPRDARRGDRGHRRRAPSTPSPPTTRRTPAARRCRSSSAARSASSAWKPPSALALEELVHPGKITLNRMVELFTTGPDARVAAGPGHAGARRARRRDGFQHRI